MPKKSDMLMLMEDATSFCDDYREKNIDPVHQRADNAYHGLIDNQEEYEKRGRSMLFIPKTRDHVRRWVTTIVNSFYVSDDVVTLLHPHPMYAKFTNEVFNIRLELHTNFFKFLSQAAHCHCKYGNAAAKVGWDYQEGYREEFDEETQTKIEVFDPIVDSPFFEMIPFENLMFDYRVIGSDPMQQSPFLRHWIPTYRSDVEERFRAGDWTRPKQLLYDRVAGRNSSSAENVRKARQGIMSDPGDETLPKRDVPDKLSYDQTWVVENYFRIGGTDWTWLSLGDEYIITEAVRVTDKFPHGKRPYVLSQFDPEAFRSYSDGIPEMFKDLQAEINAIRNQRRDNVSLVLNAGHYVRRGAGINIASLQSSRPGRIVLGDRIGQEDIRREEVADITASAYREEEIAHRDIEEISQQSANRLGQTGNKRTTATEAAIASSATGEMEGFVVKGFVETFVRPLLEMFMYNLVHLETDEVVLTKASIATGLPPERELLTLCEVIVNAGMGSTNKEIRAMRLERIIDRMIQAQINPIEVIREWLPLVGLKNADRLLPPPQMGMPGQMGPGAQGGPAGPAGAAAGFAPGKSSGENIAGSAPPQLQAKAQSTPNFGGLAGELMQ